MRNNKIIQSAYAIVIAAVVLAGCSAPQATAEEPVEKETPVQATAITKGSLVLNNEIVGSVAPSASLDVYPKMAGELLELNVKKGDHVAKGAKLGRVDTQDLRDQLEMERSNLELSQLQYKTLYNSGMHAESGDQLAQAEIQLEQSKLRIKQTEKQIANAVIDTPIAGQIVNVNGELGQYVSQQSPVFTVVTLNPITLTASLSSNQLRLFQNEEEATVLIPDLGKTYTANITYLSAITDNTGFYTMEAKIANEEYEILPGMVTKFQLEQELVQDALLVPTASIVEKSGESYIFIIVDGYAVQKAVEIIEGQTELSAVKGDFNEGDQVVVRGQTTLTNGNKVKLIEEAQ